jgi:hypothetical protein
LGWTNESEFCDLTNSVRFIQSPYFRPSHVRFRSLHRRLYFDGLATGKTEIGIGTSRRDHIKIAKKDVRELVPFFLDLPVRLPRKQNVKLSDSGKQIAKLYALASTDIGYQANNTLPNWWVTAGVPLVFFQCGEDEEIPIPYSDKPIDIPKEYGKNLIYSSVQYNGRYFPVWFFNTSGGLPDKATNLRLILSRLHTEHECLRIILSHLMGNKLRIEPKSRASQMLQDYFTATLNRIDQMEHEADEQIDAEIAGIARTAMGAIHPHQAERVYQSLELINMRRNIFHRVRRYTEKVESTKTPGHIRNMQESETETDEEEMHRLQLIQAHKRRLRVLELQKAQQGTSVEPKIITEIEDIEKEIQRLEDSDG